MKKAIKTALLGLMLTASFLITLPALGRPADEWTVSAIGETEFQRKTYVAVKDGFVPYTGERLKVGFYCEVGGELYFVRTMLPDNFLPLKNTPASLNVSINDNSPIFYPGIIDHNGESANFRMRSTDMRIMAQYSQSTWNIAASDGTHVRIRLLHGALSDIVANFLVRCG